MRDITRPCVQKQFRSLLWGVTWPVRHNSGCPAYAFREFLTWAEAYKFARCVA
jgi:hypothetical protein